MKPYRIIILFTSVFIYLSCAHKSLEMSQGQVDLRKAKEYQQAGRYELAIEEFSNIKNKYPLSPEAVEAELGLAETFYLQGSYLEARATFESFIDLHPKHKQIDFAYYRVAMSYYMQIPPTIDRDLTPASQAIDAFNEFLKKYPKSSYSEDARGKKEESKNKLAQKEYYIANFYFKQKQYLSAQGRFKKILTSYKGSGFDEKALFHLGLCYYRQNQKGEARNTLNLLLKQYPKSTYVDQAKKILEELPHVP